MFGYAGKMLQVDLTEKRIQYRPLKDGLIEDYVGGTGFATSVIYSELPPETPPLSPKNKLVFAAGPLTGTIAPMAGRYVVLAKSPLTGLWGESDAGGFWGPELKFAGFDMLVIEGASEEPIYLWIFNGNAEILDARHLWGLDTYETERVITNHLGKKARVACIGQAGENLVKFATIMNDKGRAAGRCGLGAVMGSKKLKAIVARGEGVIEVASLDELKKLRNQMIEELRLNPGARALSKYGTGKALAGMLKVGNLPLKNWELDGWDLKSAEAISAEMLAKSLRIGRRGCYICPIGCEKIVQVSSGPFTTVDGRGPEYETLAALGSLCLNDNLESVVKANDLCNRYGLDTIEAGTAISLAMECFEKKLLSKQDIGMELKWGDGEAIVKLVGMTARRQGFGNIIAEGVRNAAEKIGKNASDLAMHVKGSSIPMHDPRINIGMGLKYVTLSMGAYHAKGCPGVPPEVMQVVNGQNFAEVTDCLVMCDFAFRWPCYLSAEYIPKLISAATGRQIEWKELAIIGEKIFTMKRVFATKLGISRKDDKLPKRFTAIPRIREGRKHLANLEPMLTEYYKLRGWNDDGIVTKEKLRELEIHPL